MINAVKEYKKIVSGLLDKVNQESIKTAAGILTETIKKDKLIYVLGTGGHDYMAAEEMFLRTGGLVNIHPIFPSGLDLSHGGLRSIIIERCSGYISGVLDYYAPLDGDVLIVVSSYGISNTAIEIAIRGKELGAKIIAITSTSFCKRVPEDHPARHSSKQNLCEMNEVDVLIDNHLSSDDAVLSFEEMDVMVSPVSTILNIFILNSLVAATVEQLLSDNITPKVWKNFNLPGGDDYNQKYINMFSKRIKKL